MDIDAWLAAAQADADRRGLPELKPMLATLAVATKALRAGLKPRPANARSDAAVLESGLSSDADDR